MSAGAIGGSRRGFGAVFFEPGVELVSVMPELLVGWEEVCRFESTEEVWEWIDRTLNARFERELFESIVL